MEPTAAYSLNPENDAFCYEMELRLNKSTQKDSKGSAFYQKFLL